MNIVPESTEWTIVDSLYENWQAGPYPDDKAIANVGWDLRRRLGTEATEEYILWRREFCGVLRASAEAEWATFDREQLPRDRTLEQALTEVIRCRAACKALRDEHERGRPARRAADLAKLDAAERLQAYLESPEPIEQSTTDAPPLPCFAHRKTLFEAEHGTLDDSKTNLWREWQRKHIAEQERSEAEFDALFGAMRAWLDDTDRDATESEVAEWNARLVEHNARYDHLWPKFEESPAMTDSLPTPLPQPNSSLITPRGDFVPPDSDDSLALEFVARRADELRYCEEFGRWLQWNGARWRTDRTSAVYDMVRQHLRQMAANMHFQEAKKVTAAKTIAAVERLARTDRIVATVADNWDANPWLLGTPSGTVDLRVGAIRPASPNDHITKQTAVAPGGDCPTWRAFLAKSLAGDTELIAFVQRMLGYALTGDTREHALFFLYGPGGNGKGVLLNTVAGIMGDYQKTAPVDTFIDSAHERHPTDLAGLRGARLVTASETEKGRRWAEAKIKMLTGGDRISARFMRQDFFEFVPQFKLVIAGNHKPGLRSVDEAMRRRLHLIPFTVNIPEHERDTSLPERLKAEWPGILAWMIEGCLAWQRGGLQPPAAVRSATDEYLSSEDVLTSWFDDRCEQVPDAFASRQELFGSWNMWARNAGEYVGTLKGFIAAMRAHGFEESKRVGVRGFRGVRLTIPLPPPPRA